MSSQRGDVVWAPDPFKTGENPRPWLILNNDSHPFGDEEYMTVTLTTTPHDEGVPLDDADWVEVGCPGRASPRRGRWHRRSTPRSFGGRADTRNRSSEPSSTCWKHTLRRRISDDDSLTDRFIERKPLGVSLLCCVRDLEPTENYRLD